MRMSFRHGSFRGTMNKYGGNILPNETSKCLGGREWGSDNNKYTQNNRAPTDPYSESYTQ